MASLQRLQFVGEGNLGAASLVFCWFLVLFLVSSILGISAIGITYLIFAPDLPEVETLRDVQLQVPLRVFTRDEKLIGVFGEKRRIPVSIDELPDCLKNAFIAGEDAVEQQLMTELHHAFKRANGYSDLEISQKRSALEKVLIPESLAEHRARLQAAGFRRVDLWYRCLNFVSLLARP